MRIAVTSADRALVVWRDLLGLSVIRQTDGLIELGAGSTVLVELETGARGPVAQGATGLYHVALHVPTRRDFAVILARLFQSGYRNSPTDHLVTETTYLWDDDGNGIEIAFETPWRGRFNPDFEAGFATGALALDVEGNPHSGREPIDLDALFEELEPGANLSEPLPPGTRVGHVHLSVGDLDTTLTFYRDVLGFEEQLFSKRVGIADLRSDYPPHILAFNTWQGLDVAQPPAGLAGLRHFTIGVPEDDLVAIAARLKAADIPMRVVDGGVETEDPAGNPLQIVLT